MWDLGQACFLPCSRLPVKRKKEGHPSLSTDLVWAKGLNELTAFSGHSSTPSHTPLLYSTLFPMGKATMSHKFTYSVWGGTAAGSRSVGRAKGDSLSDGAESIPAPFFPGPTRNQGALGFPAFP